ncbi:DUF4194 domain-containing protein [Acinetobacter towneri]|uniref:DUF4194 domain-containing protein n=1 Tax=Acinetobacter towneri TaxID=202956 RepID=UPI002574BA63|nr:DUF4194 domain-containing protein [Acinetobacter towneri]MDM1486002.1 DUF4194 domain-containing protein [Acinetobacter towneri]
MRSENKIQQHDNFFEMVRRPSSNSEKNIEIQANQPIENSSPTAGAEVQHADNQTDMEHAQDRDIDALMPHAARRVLVYLMRQGVILAAENLKLFDLLCRYEAEIRRHLAEVYIQLVLDAKQGVAYIINLESIEDEQEDENQPLDDFPVLIRKRTLTVYDTLILLILRKYYQERETAGEQKIIIDVERIRSSLIPFIPLTNHDSKDRKKLNTALDKFIEKKVLTGLRGEEGRYEITPIIRYVVNAEFLQSLLSEYQQLSAKAKLQQSEQEHGESSCKK